MWYSGFPPPPLPRTCPTNPLQFIYKSNLRFDPNLLWFGLSEHMKVFLTNSHTLTLDLFFFFFFFGGF